MQKGSSRVVLGFTIHLCYNIFELVLSSLNLGFPLSHLRGAKDLPVLDGHLLYGVNHVIQGCGQLISPICLGRLES